MAPAQGMVSIPALMVASMLVSIKMAILTVKASM